MAGDWIKMRGNLWDDPRVGRLVDLTESNEAQVIGGLYWLWASADQHTEDGGMPGLSLRQIDRKTGIQGFGEALVSIGWLSDHPEGVRIVNFEEHNGASAKTRASTAKRVASFKSKVTHESENGNAQVTVQALPKQHETVTTALPREEKRREEKKEEQKTTPAPSAWVSSSELVADGLPQDLASEWLAHRKARKAKLTALAWAGFKSEVSKAGWSVEDAVRKAIARNWTAFEADWVAKAQSPPRQSYADQQRAQLAALTGARTHQGDVIDV